MINKEKVSILIPVYNSEKFLSKMFDTVLKQTYKNIEIIIVNDCSTDNSLSICKKYLEKDNRIKIISNIKNCGVAYCRNLLIKESTGEYIAFIDSDDYVDFDYIMVLYDIIKKYKVDISSCEMLPVNYNFIANLKNTNLYLKTDVEKYNKMESIEVLMYGKKISNAPHGKLFKKKVFDNIVFPNVKSFEDLSVMYKVIDNAQAVAVLKDKKYYYMNNLNSLTHLKNIQINSYSLECGEKIYEFIKKKYPQIKEAGLYMYYSQAINLSLKIPKSNLVYKEKIMEIIRKYRKIILKNKNTQKRIMFLTIASYLGFTNIKIMNYILDNLKMIILKIYAFNWRLKC